MTGNRNKKCFECSIQYFREPPNKLNNKKYKQKIITDYTNTK